MIDRILQVIFITLSLFPASTTGQNAQEDIMSRRALQRHEVDPQQDDVFSPPVSPYTDSPSSFPSVNPSISPSLIPSELPSSIPSGSPSNYPTKLPSLVPSSHPSVLPSSLPSAPPSSYPTTMPSAQHSEKPSEKPSQTSSENPSEQPTSLPSQFPTHSPTVSPECFPDINGIYGNLTESKIVIKFGYELETSSGDIRNEIIPSLEKQFGEALLPELFSGKCSSLLRDRFRHRLRRLAVSGLSSEPNDTILDGVECERKHSESNACHVVKGEFTIFTDGNEEGIEGRVLQNLQKQFADGKFSAAHKGIRRISYVQLDSTKNLVNSGNGTKVRSNLSSGHFAIYGVIAGVIVAALALTLLVWTFKKKRQVVDEDGANQEGPTCHIEVAVHNEFEEKLVRRSIDSDKQRDDNAHIDETEKSENDKEMAEDSEGKPGDTHKSDDFSAMINNSHIAVAEELFIERGTGSKDEGDVEHGEENLGDVEKSHDNVDEIPGDQTEKAYVKKSNESAKESDEVQAQDKAAVVSGHNIEAAINETV